jgi:biopolymer transport protein ExbD
MVQPVLIGSDGSILWNDVVISDAELRNYMAKVSELNPEPHIVLEISPSAACERVDEVRKIMNDSPICNGRYPLCSEGWNWKRWPEVGGP